MVASIAKLAQGPGHCTVVGGCEMWLHDRLQVKPSQAVALVSAEDRLLVRARVFGEAFLFVVLYAPRAAHTEAVIE